MKKLAVLLFAGAMLASTGCTMRHSRTVTDVGAAGGRRVSTSSTGLEILSIEINDTESADKLASQLRSGCSALTNIEVDYRTMGILIVGIPKLTVSGDCR